MIRIFILICAGLLAFAWHGAAEASADFGCGPSLKLAHSNVTSCDNVVILSPGNDTRVNLAMLLLDKRGGASRSAGPQQPLFGWWDFRQALFPVPDEQGDGQYAYGEGSRCRSNAGGAAAFEAALGKARRLPAAEHAALAAARRALQPNCAGASSGAEAIAAAAAQVKSADGKAFATYLQGALAFYDGDYDGAAAHFGALRKAKQPWLKETGRYMLGRVEVNRVQVEAFDEYGYPKGPEFADQAVIDAADAGLRNYLKDYPRGLYAGSARGLLRRVYWIGGHTDALAAEYSEQFSSKSPSWSEGDLAEEIDTKLLPGIEISNTRDPILLAMLDLRAMRGCSGDGCDAPISRQQLEAQRGHFARDPQLFDYLLAAHAFYVAGRPDEVLQLLPEEPVTRDLTYLAFSRQMLRRLALTALKRPPSEEAWLALVPATSSPFQRAALELGIAMHYERANALDKVFADGSPVQLPSIRETLLANVADAGLLRRQARNGQNPQHEREVAIFTLLYKDLTRGAYSDFLTDLALVPPDASESGGLYDLLGNERIPIGLFIKPVYPTDFRCPDLREIAARLAKDPQAANARLCLADFMRLNGFDDFSLDSPPPEDELGGTPSLFLGAPYSRLEVYKSIIADPKAPAGDKAYALYRAVRCYAPSGNNSCGGEEVPVDQRKAWFYRLKRDYPASHWAKNMQFYW